MEPSVSESIPKRLLEHARKRSDQPAYFVRNSSGEWKPYNWKAYADQAAQVAKSLIALSVEPSSAVGIVGFNRPEWVLMQLGAMMSGAVPVGIYLTCSPREVAYILEHSEAAVVLVEDESQWEKVKAERERLPGLKKVVTMSGVRIDDPLCMTWEEFLSLGGERETELAERLSLIGPDRTALYIYTSGTTGPPKAVMLSHENLAWTASCAKEMSGLGPSERILSYLPLSHIAEQMFSVHVPITVGYPIYFARSMEQVPEDLKEVQPTVFLGVPRVWEKMRAKIQSALEGASPMKARLAKWAMGVGQQTIFARNEGRQVSGLLRLKYAIADRLVLSKVRGRLGFDELRFGVTGAAPIAREVLEFFAGLGISIHEVYGQSEGSAPTTFNRPGETRLGTVGKPITGSEVILADDGEIRTRGPHVFLGYFKDETATSATLQDGWLLTGDLGEFDEDGFLKIVGRKKEIIVTAGGKNIAPVNIEAALQEISLVSQAVVIGDNRPYISALVTLDPEAVSAFRKQAGSEEGPDHLDPKVREAVQQAINDEVNPQFARVQHVRKFEILPREFSVEGGELTPSLKLKRRVVAKNYAPNIEALYEDKVRTPEAVSS